MDTKKINNTIIVGRIEFLNRKAIIHEIKEVFHAGSEEEQNVIEDIFDVNESGIDYITIELYQGNIEVTKDLLKQLVTNKLIQTCEQSTYHNN
jgi:hypothetical protein